MKNNATIRVVEDRSTIPLDLLLAADPSLEKIQQYLPTGKAIAATDASGEIIGVCIFTVTGDSGEINNISVLEKFQGTGTGKLLLEAAKAECRRAGLHFLTVGTGNSSLGQLAFYQKCGFEMTKIIPGYFLENYPEPIFENGIQCKHQIILTCDLNDF